MATRYYQNQTPYDLLVPNETGSGARVPSYWFVVDTTGTYYNEVDALTEVLVGALVSGKTAFTYNPVGSYTEGSSGTSGFSGYSGKSGFSGSGVSGWSGYSGESLGDSGYSGVNGTSGYSGVNGASGYSGVDGASGYSGAVGTSGYSGATPGLDTINSGGPITITPLTDITPLTIRASASPGTAHIVQWQASDNSPLGHIAHTGLPNIGALPIYADNAAAITGTLVAGDLYMTATGSLMIVYTP